MFLLANTYLCKQVGVWDLKLKYSIYKLNMFLNANDILKNHTLFPKIKTSLDKTPKPENVHKPLPFRTVPFQGIGIDGTGY